MIDRRAGDGDELRGIAAIERQIEDAALIDDLGNRILLRLHHAGVGLHLHLFHRLTHSHGYIDLDVVVDSEEKAGLHVGLKSGSSGLERVGADGQTRDGVEALRVGDGVVDRAGVHCGDPDLGAGHQRARLVCDTTCHGSHGDCLRIERLWQRHEGQQQSAGSNAVSWVVIGHNEY